MTYLSILDKMKILFNTLLDFKFILIFTILISILTIIFLLKKISKKKYTLFMILSFILVFALSIISNYKVLSNTFDNFSNIFFGNIYFPSIYVYIAVLVISFIAFITSMLNVMLKRVYKVVNTIMFITNNILFVTILNIIAKNKIDIFSISSLYTNTSLVALLEISMNLFILWIIALTVIYITNSICDRIDVKKKVVKSVEEVESVVSNETIVPNEILEVTSVVPSVEVKEPEVVMPIENTIDLPKVEEKVEPTEEHHPTFSDILNGNIEAVYYDNNSTFNDIALEISNPQELYEEKYNTNNESNLQDIVTNTIQNEVIDTVKEEPIADTTYAIEDIEEPVVQNEIIEDKPESITNTSYTIEDYKKIIKMLKGLKLHANTSNISVDDAVTLSLISNYSLDDCLKFKEILKSNLN